MKFKELKKVLSCCDTFGISFKIDNIKRTFYCNDYNIIDEISNSYSLNEKEVIFISAIDENYLFISLK